MSIEQDAEGGHHLDAPLVASPWSDERAARRGARRGRRRGRRAPGRRDRRARRRRPRGRRARAGARPLARRRALRARRARGRRAPRRRGVGGRGRRRRRAAARRSRRRRRSTRCSTAATPATHSRLVVRGPRIERRRDRARSTATPEPAAHDARRASVRGRRYVEDRDTAAVLSRQQGPRDRLHRALDDGARRDRRHAVAAGRRRRLTRLRRATVDNAGGRGRVVSPLRSPVDAAAVRRCVRLGRHCGAAGSRHPPRRPRQALRRLRRGRPHRPRHRAR